MDADDPGLGVKSFALAKVCGLEIGGVYLLSCVCEVGVA